MVLPSLVGSFWPTLLGRNKSYCRILMPLSGPLLAVTNHIAESFWPTLGPRLAVTNRIPESWWLFLVTNRTGGSWWLFLVHSSPQQIGLSSLGGSFWPTLGRNNSYCRVLVALSGPRLALTNRTAESWWLFLANSWP